MPARPAAKFRSPVKRSAWSTIPSLKPWAAKAAARSMSAAASRAKTPRSATPSAPMSVPTPPSMPTPSMKAMAARSLSGRTIRHGIMAISVPAAGLLAVTAGLLRFQVSIRSPSTAGSSLWHRMGIPVCCFSIRPTSLSRTQPIARPGTMLSWGLQTGYMILQILQWISVMQLAPVILTN